MREMDPELASNSSVHGAAIIDRHAIHIIFVHALMTIPVLFYNNQHDSFGSFSSGFVLCGNAGHFVHKAHFTRNPLAKARIGMVEAKNKSTSDRDLRHSAGEAR